MNKYFADEQRGWACESVCGWSIDALFNYILINSEYTVAYGVIKEKSILYIVLYNLCESVRRRPNRMDASRSCVNEISYKLTPWLYLN